MSSPPNTSPEEVLHTTPSWQFCDNSDLENHHLGSFTRDEFSGHTSHLVSRVTKRIQGESDGAPPCAKPSGSAQDHMMHYSYDMWKINTTPPPHSQEIDYGPTAANDTSTYPYDYSSSSDSHHSSHDGGSCVHFSDYHPSLASSSFTPINQNHFMTPFPSSS